jgi:protocatechuate 3,4-dioxygenase beta subunit
MTTLVADKLKRRLTTTSAATTVITILSFTLLLTFVTFVCLTQTSFAQTPNTNQTSTAQPKLITYPCKLTESTVQGPEYKAGAPFKQGQDFAKGLQGQRLELSGRVLSMGCKPVQGAVLDLWQTNSTGDYDYEGFNLRGKIVTDKDGKYVLDTIYPARLLLERDNVTYTRPSHIHVMVGVPGQPIITTQVYFEGLKDFAVKDTLITKPVTDANGTKIANFDIVVEDHRGFDASQGLRGNPTIGVLGQGSNK